MSRARAVLGLAVIALAGCSKTEPGVAAGRAFETSSEGGDPPALPPEAQFGEAARSAYTDAARAFLSRKTSAAAYLARSRAVSGKLRLAAAQADYVEAWVAGDADGDLVPDDRDRCPESEKTAATDDDGCEVKVDSDRGPRDEEVLAVVKQLGFAASPDCAEAPVPDTPRALKSGYDNVTRQTYAFAVSPVTNQPEGCAVYYEVRVVMWGAWESWVDTRRVVFRDRDATERSHRLVFRITGASAGDAAFIFAYAHNARHVLQVRAMNGAGLVSGWSPLVESPVSFEEP